VYAVGIGQIELYHVRPFFWNEPALFALFATTLAEGNGASPTCFIDAA
jgi:hypothetical protein